LECSATDRRIGLDVSGVQDDYVGTRGSAQDRRRSLSASGLNPADEGSSLRARGTPAYAPDALNTRRRVWE
jgi:hypothetical protein